MGLFDFFRRKPARRATGDDEGPSPEYVLAHYALRQMALSHPLKFLALIASPNAHPFLEDLMKDIVKDCGRPASIRTKDIRIHPMRLEDYPCAIIEFPNPQNWAEAHMTALLVMVNMEGDLPDEDAKNIPARYFTLEKSFTADHKPRTVFAEWSLETHSNYGDGPEVSVSAFAECILGHLGEK